MAESHSHPFESVRFKPSLVVRDGLVAGLCGALVVALAHLVADVLAGDPLRTPTLLGLLLNEGPEAALTAQGNIGVAFRFTCFHIAFWLLLGGIGSWLISLVDAHPRLASFAFSGFAFVFISVLYGAGAFTLPGLPTVHLWIGTLLGSIAAAGYLVWRHPHLAGHIQRERLTETTRSWLERALEHEAADLAAYGAIAERFPEPIFAKMVEEKKIRSEGLRIRCESLGLPPSESPEGAHHWEARTLDDALREAMAFERRTIDFYDRFIAAIPELQFRDLFIRLRYHVLDTTIPELEQALEASAGHDA